MLPSAKRFCAVSAISADGCVPVSRASRSLPWFTGSGGVAFGPLPVRSVRSKVEVTVLMFGKIVLAQQQIGALLHQLFI